MEDTENFLSDYVDALLKDIGLEDLSGEQRERYVPQLLRQVQDRIGIELIPKLSDEQLDRFSDLANDNASSNEAWKDFWLSSIPDFDQELERILSEFAKEAREILSV
ncbi:MAG: hypothetical protein HYY51_01230 [Candidatus Magasanikbacteria bacterium]|nr:hypothetical protein [Candidatus Magasanikbacteria bacterium]